MMIYNVTNLQHRLKNKLKFHLLWLDKENSKYKNKEYYINKKEHNYKSNKG
jgi:hypothetical protein